ncbi:putative dolichyl-diphosphooligosaccharide--protein glycosyltransferase subunit 3B [Camellia lanceoleosa]|uniref:Dolichyl-diphosphooligosaccharide--protein glycosyltransferase subunit 3B n=1 Tax=Camellia lanceoleosa TaxID=1840588 RepID=A0ACC0FG94_9ERIC|nr:putative dolichyl-diphosphooligosaccharide--protein glycosyltransferase subunit 3B [Camellia lanceoleosa]
MMAPPSSPSSSPSNPNLQPTTTPRPFSLLIFFDASQLHDKQELHLKSLRSEFSLVSSSFISNNNPSSQSKLFFCYIEFKESQSSFAQFGEELGDGGGLL